MRWKCEKVFLLILLSLVSYGSSHAQSCLSMNYDANGNRISMIIEDCSIQKNMIKKDLVRSVMPNYESDDVVSVYPNPNNGILTIRTDAEDDVVSKYEILNINGFLLDNNEFNKMTTINIGNYPSGIYLLKIINGNKMYTEVVVKL